MFNSSVWSVANLLEACARDARRGRNKRDAQGCAVCTTSMAVPAPESAEAMPPRSAVHHDHGAAPVPADLAARGWRLADFVDTDQTWQRARAKQTSVPLSRIWINQPALMRKLDEALDRGSPGAAIVDVSGVSPRLGSAEDDALFMQRLEAMRKSLSVHSAASAVLDLGPPSPAALGWILDYPVVYFLPSPWARNCLANEPLVVVHLGFYGARFASFSYPAALESALRVRLDDARAGFAALGVSWDEASSITLSAVAL